MTMQTLGSALTAEVNQDRTAAIAGDGATVFRQAAEVAVISSEYLCLALPTQSDQPTLPISFHAISFLSALGLREN